MSKNLVPHSLQGLLLLTFLSLNFLAIGGLVAWSARSIETDNVEQAEHELEIQSHLIADALRAPLEDTLSGTTNPDGSLASQTQSYAAKNSVRVTVLDANLAVLYSSEPAVKSGQVLNSVEVLAAQGGTEEHSIRSDGPGGAERLYVATAIQNRQGAIEGYVQISVPTAPIYADTRQSQLGLFGVGAAVLLLTAVAGTLLARGIARPVSSLTQTSEALASGRLGERVTPGGPDEIRRLGQAFNQMADRVSRVLTRQKEFVANAAHELRSPLTSLRLRLEMLQGPARQNPQVLDRYLAQMDGEVMHLQALVEQLLTLSTVDAGSHAASHPLDLAPLLQELVEEMSPLARQAELELTCSIPAHLPAVTANADQMRTVFRNLVDNAIKYSLPGGRILLTAQAAGSELSVSVADTGVGIPKESLVRIFERFYRVDAAHSARRGSGLGLALVQSIVQAHGGRVQVESEQGQGSTFTIFLSAAQPVPPLTLAKGK